MALLLCLLLLTLTVYFALSLLYLCWQFWSALRKGSPWLRRYRSAMFVGMAACLLVATFVDGSYRFWDRPFEVRHWATLVFVERVRGLPFSVFLCVTGGWSGESRGAFRSGPSASQ